MPLNLDPIELRVSRDETGQYKVSFVNLWRPIDVHQATLKIQQQYKLYRREFVESLKKPKTLTQSKGSVNEPTESAD